MKTIRKQLNYLRRQTYQKALTFLGITSSLFIFQACYGTPQDLHPDLLISCEGVVKSEDTREPIRDLEVRLRMNDYETFKTYTGENGKFYFDIMSELDVNTLDVSINDIDEEQNGSFYSKDTTITTNKNSESLIFFLKRKN